MSRLKNTIQFLLNDRIQTIVFREDGGLRPTTTVLNYLRSLPDFKGVKEGCAEGDCGACTLVLAWPADGKMAYHTVDSCLVFLPFIHGMQLITVEGLAENDRLHPVQDEMVSHNGTQCGFCTPGMVMSAFGLYKNHPHADREAVEEALSGNLCRCTGYRPVADAVAHACACSGEDHFSRKEKEVVEILNEIRRDQSPLIIEARDQKYVKAFTLTDALIYRAAWPGALIISGATDAALRQSKHNEYPPHILDISAVPELKFYSESDTGLAFGAGISLEELRTRSRGIFPALYETLSRFGSLQIRNLASPGGNLGSASPIGDLLPLLFASNARITLQSVSSERSIPVEEFIVAYRRTDLRPDELITGIHIPAPLPGMMLRCYKVSRRRDLDISTVSAGFSLKLEQGHIEAIILAFGGMAATPLRAKITGEFLIGKPWTRSTVEEAMPLLEQEFNPLSDARAGADYRRKIAGNLLLKFFLDTTGSEQ
jgi:xanthine dehydrogenase small subunit